MELSDRRKYRNRGLSNTLAGLIILTFIVTTLIPLLLSLITNTQVNVKLAQNLVQRIREANAPINVTLDIAESSLNEKVYIGENIDTNTHIITLINIRGNDGRNYFVKPGKCITGCTAGTISVTVEPHEGCKAIDGSLLLSPGGTFKIRITNGELASLMLLGGGYVKPILPQTVAGAGQVQYAAVAGSVKSNYFNLSGVTDLTELANDPNIVIATDPSSSKTESNIFWHNALKSICLIDEKLYEGGFQPANNLNQSKLDALFIHNIEPVISTFVIGGAGSPYTPPYKTALLASFYTYAPFYGNEPGVIAARRGNKWFAVFLWPNDDYMIINVVTKDLHEDSVLLALYEKMVENAYGKIAYLEEDIDNEKLYILNRRANVTFDTSGFGIYIYIPYGRYYYSINEHILPLRGGPFVIFCPPHSIANIKEVDKGLMLRLSNCPVIGGKDGIDNPSYGTATEVNITIGEGEYRALSNGYFGRTNNATINATLLLYGIFNTGRDSNNYTRPNRIKLKGDTLILRTYNDAINTELNDTKAFGFYYYSGNGDAEIAHGILDYVLRDVTLTFFDFVPDETSGLEPYTLVADTDGNGLNEIIFVDEEADWGTKYSYDDLLSHLYIRFDENTNSLKAGCLDETLKKVYLKFIGPYGINGSQIAQVSIQIRYKFHDNAGDDVDDVEDPKEYLMSFQLISSNGTVYMTSDYIYQQLMGLEDTWPPNTQWVTDSAFLLLPNKPENYYVAFVVNDPYWFDTNSYKDDMDFSLAVEWLGMWYLHR